MSRSLYSLFLPFLLGSVSVFAQTTPGEVRPSFDAEVLLRLPETLIDGLQPLIDKALEASPQVIDARLKALAAAAREEESRSLTRPRADVYLDAGYHKNDAGNPGSFQTYYNVSAEQPLWHWNALDNQKLISKIQRQMADNDYDEARRTFVLEIRQRYLALVLQKRDVADVDATCERLGKHLKSSQEQAGLGHISADVLTGEQLEVLMTEVTRDRQREAFGRALREFAVMNGLPSFLAESLPDEISCVPAAALALFSPKGPAPAVQGVPPAALARAEGELTTARLNASLCCHCSSCSATTAAWCSTSR